MKKERTTLQTLKRYKRISRGLKTGVIATPLIPLITISAINWDTWFGKAGASLPLGFTALLSATVLAVIGVLRSDTIVNKKQITLLCLGLLFFALGCVDLFLASILAQLGKIMLSIGGALVASFIEYQIDEKVVQPKITEYTELVEKYALDKKSSAKKDAEEKAKKESEENEARKKKEYDGTDI